MDIMHISTYISVSMYLPSAMLATISTFMTIIRTDKPAPLSASDAPCHCHTPLPAGSLQHSCQPSVSTADTIPIATVTATPLYHEPHCHRPTQHLYSVAPLPLPPCCHRDLPAAPPGSTVPATSLLLNHYLPIEMPPPPLLTVTTVTAVKNIQINNNRVSYSEKLPKLYSDQTRASSPVS